MWVPISGPGNGRSPPLLRPRPPQRTCECTPRSDEARAPRHTDTGRPLSAPPGPYRASRQPERAYGLSTSIAAPPNHTNGRLRSWCASPVAALRKTPVIVLFPKILRVPPARAHASTLHLWGTMRDMGKRQGSARCGKRWSGNGATVGCFCPPSARDDSKASNSPFYCCLDMR